MINKIIDSVALAIHGEFGDVDIYTDSVEQGLEYPCFFVFCVEPTISIDLGTRYARTNKFMIHYMTNDSMERYNAMERLFKALEIIDVEGKLFRGTEMSASFSDDVLNFSVNYDLFVYESTNTEDAMEALEYRVM